MGDKKTEVLHSREHTSYIKPSRHRETWAIIIRLRSIFTVERPHSLWGRTHTAACGLPEKVPSLDFIPPCTEMMNRTADCARSRSHGWERRVRLNGYRQDWTSTSNKIQWSGSFIQGGWHNRETFTSTLKFVFISKQSHSERWTHLQIDVKDCVRQCYWKIFYKFINLLIPENHLINIVTTCGCVTMDSIWVDEWIYWPPIYTTRKYK